MATAQDRTADERLDAFFISERLEQDGPRVFRPYQYMGTKLRALDAIVQLASETAPHGGRALDLFTGSSVVAQALANVGYSVDAFDALTFCAASASAILGMGRTDGEQLSGLVAQFSEAVEVAVAETPYREWLISERDALADRDGGRLLSLSVELPQIWRSGSASPAIRELFDTVGAHPGNSQAVPPIATTYYAGSYFGIRQTVEIDAIRRTIEVLPMSCWQRDAALCCLVAAMSLSAFTPGKHFAQPHKIERTKDLSFHQERALSDRSVSVLDAFLRTASAIDRLPYWSTHDHRGLHKAFEQLVPEAIAKDVSLVYADPPYTAQQYSRFYHVPESIVTAQVPLLQSHRGRVTSGLYPTDRFKSRFCSKTQSTKAFVDMFSFTRALGVPIILSYAQSGSGKTGNERMVSLDFLVNALKAAGFQSVKVRTLKHAYRQMNHTRRAVTGRDDQELLIAGVP